MISSGVKAAEKGTVIEVRNLFFNTPARKKFLKSDSVELHHIVDVVTHYALINKNVTFKLLHENHQLLHSPALDEWRENIASIYGSNIAKELLEVNYENEIVKVSGYIAKPYHSRNDKNQQIIFVNRRWVKNEGITKAVYDAFHSVLFVNKHPVFILHLELDTKRIDVNVHPHKLLIKIEQHEEVNKTVSTAIRETLKKHNLVPVLNFESDQQLNFKSEAKYNFEPTEQTTLKVKEATTITNGNYSVSSVEELARQTVTATASKLPPLRILGQVHKTYFLAETNGGVIFIDQHAAHERVLYEQFMDQFMHKEVQIQRLLEGEIIECTAAEKVLLSEHMGELERFGFVVEDFGGNSFVVKTIPSLFGRTQPKEMVRELIHKLERNRLEEVKEEIVTRMACRSAMMAGDELNVPQMEIIIRNLENTELPFTCPHGRPTMIKTSVEELEKKFRRKG